MARSPSAQSPPRPRRSLVLASLDIGRALAERDGITFRAQGTCMYPTVRPGDVLRVRPARPEDMVVGDIAVCRRSGYLFGHRVVSLDQRDGSACVITRPDRARGGDDGPTFSDDLLGVVVGIERGGAPMPLETLSRRGMVGAGHRVRLALLEAWLVGRPRLLAILAWMQGRWFYRRLVRGCFARALSRARFVVRVPLNATLGDAVFRETPSDAFAAEVSRSGRAPDGWTVVAFLGDSRVVAGSVEVVRPPAGGWSIGEPQTRVRYGGTGLAEILRREAASVVARSGAVEGQKERQSGYAGETQLLTREADT